MNESFLNGIADRLREARQLLGLSQEAAAALAGVTRVQWGRYERGLSVPSGEVLIALIKAGADVPYILVGDRSFAPVKTLNAEEQVLLDHYTVASRAVRNATLGALIGARPSGGGVEQVFHGQVGQVNKGSGHGHTVNMGRPKKSPKGG